LSPKIEADLKEVVEVKAEAEAGREESHKIVANLVTGEKSSVTIVVLKAT
jgi:hypothetical protein